MARNHRTANGRETEKLLNRTIPPDGSPRIEFRDPHRRELLIMREISQIENRLSLFQAAREGIVKCVKNHCQSETNLDEKDARGLTALHYAAISNQVQVAEVLLEYGANIDTQGINDMTPLQLAVRYNCKMAVKLLLEKGADPSITNTEGSTALHFAARWGYKEITEMLLADPRTNVNHSDKTKTTPFHLACLCGNGSICKMLLEHGADIEVRTVEGRRPLHFAASQGHEEVVRLLITHGSASLSFIKEYLDGRDIENNTALHLACRKGHAEVARLCLSHGADVNAEQNFNTPQHLAATSGVVELVELLIANGAETDAWDREQRTPLHRAASFNHLNVIKVLLEKGAKIDSKDKDGYTPFLSAVRYGRTEAANFLLESGAEMSACEESMRSCLHLAVKFQHFDTLRMLLGLADTALLHNMDKDMKIALHYAASSGNFEMIKALLDKQCTVGLRDVSERTALHLAASHGHVTCVDLLGKAAPTHVNDHDERGLTPLHLAAMKGNSNVCATLLHIGADVTARDSNRRTPLHCAAETGKVRTVEVLLLVTNVTSELEAQDNKNDTPLHLASRNGHVDVVELLLKQGSDVMTRNNKGMTSLDVAIQERRCEAAKCFVQDDRWFDLFLNQTKECQRPMKNLIEKLPEVAKIAMDRCVTYSEHGPSHLNFSASFDFRLLDPGSDEETTGSKQRFFGPTTMVQHNREELLMHPLTHALLRWKWVTLGKGVYYLNLLMYLLFVSLMTAFIVNSRSKVKIFLNATQEVGEDNKLFNIANRNNFSLLVPIVIVVFAIAQMIKELYQIYLQRLKYFTHASNLLDWLVYIWALFFMIPFTIHRSYFAVGAVLWPSGAGLVLFSFANLISSLRRFGFFGIHITMFLEVLKTALRVLLVFSLFIVGFAIAFFILFKEQPAFHSVGWSFVKTTMMMFGELDYGSTIVNSLGETNPVSGAPLVPAPLPSVLFFYGFCVLMSVLLMNLLVGLAVGDIDTIQKNATISTIAMHVEFVAEVDQRYPRWLLRKVYKPALLLKPNKPQGILQWLMIYSLEDTSLGLKRDFFEKPEDAADERLERVQEQIEDQRERIETFQNILHEQNKLLKLMAAKLDVQEGFTLNVSDFIEPGDMSDSCEGIGVLQAREEEEEGSHQTVQLI